METNWTQLIERYLQNELSEEGKIAFEQELDVNPELREELEMHQLIQSAAKRASQRTLIQQTGRSYLRNLRIKQFTAGIVVTAVAAVGIVYWFQNKNEAALINSKKEVSLLSKTEEITCRAYQINNQPNLAGGKSSLIQPTGWQTDDEHDSQSNAWFSSWKGRMTADNAKTAKRDVFVINPLAANKDSIPLPKPTVTVLGYTNDKLNGEVIENQTLSNPVGKNMLWIQKYDSVGKFNDLYCGYALVMDKSKFGFVDPDGKVFIPLMYDQIVVTTNIKSSKQKNKRQKKKVLYIPKRSGKDVKDCDEQVGKSSIEVYPEEVKMKGK